jgi:hypothetical protein
MLPDLLLSEAQKAYAGPERLQPFADVLPFIGEIVITFSWLERRMTWAIESMLVSTKNEADRMEAFVKNFSARVEFLDLIGQPIARETLTCDCFSKIITDLKEANKFRNLVIHNSVGGVSMEFGLFWPPQVSAVKGRYHEKPDKRSYKLSTEELREKSKFNLELCNTIQQWVLTVRPNAENRVP